MRLSLISSAREVVSLEPELQITVVFAFSRNDGLDCWCGFNFNWRRRHIAMTMGMVLGGSS
jgi:hypothetical protein